MSASTIPTDRPFCANAVARLTVMEDFPTPPLPEAMAYTRVVEAGWANGITGSATPPRRDCRSSRRCSSVITSVVTVTSPTPAMSATAAWVLVTKVFFMGQPAMVRYISTATSVPVMSMDFTMFSSVMGLPISGSSTRERALRTSDSVIVVVITDQL